jgi:nicotinamidase-related amidase
MTSLQIDPSKTALLVMDLQEMMRGRPMAPHSSQQVFDQAAKLLAAFRSRSAFVVLVKIGGSPDGKDRLHPICDSSFGGAGALTPESLALVRELNVQPSDYQITKRQWGAFYGTDLDLQLRRRGITTLVLSGIATAFVVESTARDAYERGYNQIFAEDAMTSMTAEDHKVAITTIFPRIGLVRSTAEILAAIAAVPAI